MKNKRQVLIAVGIFAAVIWFVSSNPTKSEGIPSTLSPDSTLAHTTQTVVTADASGNTMLPISISATFAK